MHVPTLCAGSSKLTAKCLVPTTSGRLQCCPPFIKSSMHNTLWQSCKSREFVLNASESSTSASTTTSSSEELETTTKKFGLEAGLLKALTNKGADGKSRTQQAKDLLARYGSAYLLTSISFALVSFAACYAAVSAGVDVGSLLTRVGLQVTETNEQVGTVAIAYAAHKALSPVRFPPTVALTPWVAKLLGKEQEKETV